MPHHRNNKKFEVSELITSFGMCLMVQLFAFKNVGIRKRGHAEYSITKVLCGLQVRG